jgi:hypothetical protein
MLRLFTNSKSVCAEAVGKVANVATFSDWFIGSAFALVAVANTPSPNKTEKFLTFSIPSHH